MSSPPKATQDFVPVQEVRDGTLVLKDGGLRAIVLASSLNFALKSEEEQVALIGQFQNFLNSLEFTAQIFIQSRRLDIRPYIAILEEQYHEQGNDLMKIQTREYISFIKNFTENSAIMTKNFFLVIPYAADALATGRGIAGGLFGGKSQKEAAQRKTDSFEEVQTQLEQRIEVVEQGLSRLGVRIARLGTEEVIELLYKIFNPGELEKPMPLQ